MITKLIADSIVEQSENFYRKELRIGNTDVYVYNYLLVDHEAFKIPYSTELRGLTITKESAHEHVFLSMPKFFNINEIPENSIEKLTNKTIKKVQDKADGSLIQFVQIEGNILAKTKASFDNEQAKLAQAILEESQDLRFFLLDCWSNDFFPLFELVGPSNRHVLEYPEDKLVLISVRNEEGLFIDVNKFNYKYTVEAKDLKEYTLEHMMHCQANELDTEGFIVKFTDETIVKIKTLDFLSKHRLYNEADSAKVVLYKILNEELDDILSVVHESKKEMLLHRETLLVNYVNHWTQFIYDEVSTTKKERKELAQEFKEHRFFGIIMKSIHKDMDEVKSLVVASIQAKYGREQKAAEFFKFLDS